MPSSTPPASATSSSASQNGIRWARASVTRRWESLGSELDLDSARFRDRGQGLPKRLIPEVQDDEGWAHHHFLLDPIDKLQRAKAHLSIGRVLRGAEGRQGVGTEILDLERSRLPLGVPWSPEPSHQVDRVQIDPQGDRSDQAKAAASYHAGSPRDGSSRPTPRDRFHPS